MTNYIINKSVSDYPILILLEKTYDYPFRLAFTCLIMNADFKGKFKWDDSIINQCIIPDDLDGKLSANDIMDIFRLYDLVIKYYFREEEYGYIRHFNNFVSQKKNVDLRDIPDPKMKSRVEKDQKIKLLNISLLKNTTKNTIENGGILPLQKDEIHAKMNNMTLLSGPLIEYIDLRFKDLRSDILRIEDLYNSKKKEKEKLKQKEKEKVIHTLFEQWWSCYPIKIEKSQCREYFSRLNPDEDFTNKLILAVESQKKELEIRKKNASFCPEWIYPIRWLKRKRWEDPVILNEQHWKSKKIEQFKSSERPQPKFYSPQTNKKITLTPESEQEIQKLREMLLLKSKKQ